MGFLLFQFIFQHVFQNIQAYSWCGKNNVNGLRYGNGGLKLWNVEHVKNMKTHENADSERAQVDFCWETGYRNFPKTFSDTVINFNPFMAWRAGFREGVKMSLDRGERVANPDFKEKIYKQNLNNLCVWMSVGADVDYGLWAILGAREGCHKVTHSDWDFVDVRDFKWLNNMGGDARLPQDGSVVGWC